MIAINVVILSLATWRISSLLVDEDGPFEIFMKLRNLVGVKFDAEGYVYGSNELSKQFVCLWCMSLWVGILLSIIYFLLPWTIYVFMGFAFSTVSIWIDRRIWLGKKKG